jgi:hypothetical protein
MASGKLHETERIKLGVRAAQIRASGAFVGIVAMVIAAIWGGALGDGWNRFLHSYLLNFTFFLSIALGALFFVVLEHLVKAHWSVVLRRIAEIVMGTFPLLFMLSLVFLVPLLLGSDKLFQWNNEQLVETDPLISGKSAWLNSAFFSLRVIAYFAVLSAMALFYFSRSVKQDEDGDYAHTTAMRRLSGPCMIVFSITTALLAFDLIMSLEPHFFSTIFGVYYFAGCAISVYASLTLIPWLLQSSGRLTHSISVEHYHDVGKLLFAFVFFWGYIAFSQFMLIWYANLPEETGWLRPRMALESGGGVGYGWLYLFLLIFHFAVPFVCLLSRWTKRLSLNLLGKKVPILALFAAWMLAMHWLDLYGLVMPSYHYVRGEEPMLTFHPIDLLNLFAIGGLFVAAMAHRAQHINLIPVRDPSLAASLRFHNL